MKKLVCLFLFFCLLIACKPTTPKNEGVKKAEPTPKPISIEAIPNGDTILLAPHQKSEEYWAKSDAKVEFSTPWLEKALAYKRDTLPVSLASYLHPLFGMKCMQENLYFDISYHNTDEDAEEECILFFFHGCLVANEAKTIILEKENNQWKVGTIIRSMARTTVENMYTIFDEKNKVIVCKEGFWGTDGTGLSHMLYKKMGERYKEIACIMNYERSFWYMAGLFRGISGSIHTKYNFANSKEIHIARYYSVNNDNEDIFLKDKLVEETLHWDSTKQQFNSPTFDEQIKATEVVLEKEFLNLLKNGTPEQKKALDNFAKLKK